MNEDLMGVRIGVFSRDRGQGGVDRTSLATA
jgi:hypothetical protein